MTFLEELEWRGMIHQSTPEVESSFGDAPAVGYIGFDPTAPSMTIGNFVQIMLLKLFQKTGNQPIILMGGATGRIGDPSGKDKERQLKSFDELDHNLKHQLEQAKRLLDFDDPITGAKAVNNIDFYKNFNILDFLRDVGKTLTVNYMSSKESVKKRIETGISFTEFSYQLLQAYDFQRLYEEHGCSIQMGGSDQWGNITSGTEFIRRNLSKKAHAITTPLLTKADGSKFGKSESGNIWLDGSMTSPYQFYQFWINADDADIEKFTKYFTLRSKEETLADLRTYKEEPNVLKRSLAKELTIRLHGEEAFSNVQQVSELLFNKKANNEFLKGLNEKALDMVAGELTTKKMNRVTFDSIENIVDLVVEKAGFIASNGDARRAIKGNALTVNKVKVTDHLATIDTADLLQGKYIMVENGKKNKFMIVVE